MPAGHRPVALQPYYNLIERDYEGELRTIAKQERLAVLPYYSLASGFLTGKYREGTSIESPRANGAQAYLEKHAALLPVLNEVAGSHGDSLDTVSLAWLRSQPTFVAPIASAHTVEQLLDLLASATLELSAESSPHSWTPRSRRPRWSDACHDLYSWPPSRATGQGPWEDGVEPHEEVTIRNRW